MEIIPNNFKIDDNIEKNNSNSEYVHATSRHNLLSDMDFNIIADTIRCQNLKNQMNVRLMNLRRSLNNCMIRNVCQNS